MSYHWPNGLEVVVGALQGAQVPRLYPRDQGCCNDIGCKVEI